MSYRFACLLATAQLVFASETTAQQTVTLYEHTSYGGSSVQIHLAPVPNVVGNLPPSFNDRATSLRWNLSPGTVLRFYEHQNLGGREYVVTHAQSRNGGVANVGSYYNDKFSSFIWSTVDPQEGWVRFFTNAGRDGYQLTRYLSEVGTGSVSLSAPGYNDQVDSIEWWLPPDRTVMCHDEEPAGGRALSLIEVGYVADLQNQLGGLHHDNLSCFVVWNGSFTNVYADRNAPVDEICQLSSHNAHVSSAHGWLWYNQSLPLLSQLDYGARLLQLDVRDQNGVLYLTHGTWAATIAARGGQLPERLDTVLAALHVWLTVNRSEVLFFEFENYAGAALSTALEASPLGPMLYRPEGLRWPSIRELVRDGKRVVVMDDSSATRQLYRSDWQVQNDYSGFGATTARGESDPIDRKHKSLFLMNHISGTSTPLTWFGNSPNDLSALYALAVRFGQIPNFINIDGIEMADHGGLEACRLVNATLWRNPLRRATAYEFHDGCTDSIETISLPRLGNSLSIDAVPGSILMMGLSDESYAGLSLPLSLATLSACPLRVSPDVSWIVPPGGAVDIAIANDPRYVGLPLYFQAARIASATSLYLTNGIQARIGY